MNPVTAEAMGALLSFGVVACGRDGESEVRVGNLCVVRRGVFVRGEACELRSRDCGLTRDLMCVHCQLCRHNTHT